MCYAHFKSIELNIFYFFSSISTELSYKVYIFIISQAPVSANLPVSAR